MLTCLVRRQMLWNWNTIDSCFISSSWRVTSSGMFAGSCIGVILLVLSLEFLRRAVKEFDAFLVRQHRARPVPSAAPSTRHSSDQLDAAPAVDPGFHPTVVQQAIRAFLHTLQFAVAYFVMLSVLPLYPVTMDSPSRDDGEAARSRPVLTLETRLAMYYNGYIIICIFIGAFLGAFIFQWERLAR